MMIESFASIFFRCQWVFTHRVYRSSRRVVYFGSQTRITPRKTLFIAFERPDVTLMSLLPEYFSSHNLHCIDVLCLHVQKVNTNQMGLVLGILIYCSLNGSTLDYVGFVEALRHKPEGRGFDSRRDPRDSPLAIIWTSLWFWGICQLSLSSFGVSKLSTPHCAFVAWCVFNEGNNLGLFFSF